MDIIGQKEIQMDIIGQPEIQNYHWSTRNTEFSLVNKKYKILIVQQDIQKSIMVNKKYSEFSLVNKKYRWLTLVNKAKNSFYWSKMKENQECLFITLFIILTNISKKEPETLYLQV